MPIFYTHLFNDTGEFRDETGREFESDEAALAEAARSATGVLTDELPNLRPTMTIRLQVDRADGASAGIIDVNARVERGD